MNTKDNKKETSKPEIQEKKETAGITMEMEESKEESPVAAVNSKDVAADGFIYEQREAFERMTSEGALTLPEIPGFVRRFINPDARKRSGRDKLYQLEPNAEAKKIGDLYPARAPIDLVKEQHRINESRGTGRLKKEQELRRELAERAFCESNGLIRMEEKFSGVAFGEEQPKYKKPGTTKYYYAK